MANEFKHASVGTELTQAEYESTTSHVLDSQAAGDIIYASSTTQLSRLGIGTAGKILQVNSGASAPEWTATVTGVTSVLNTSLVIGRDSDNDIDFATDNTILFRASGADQIKLIDGALAPVADNDVDLGTSSLEFKDAFFDGTVTSDAFAGPLTGDVTGNADTATTLATARAINGVNFDGSAAITITAAGSTLSDTVPVSKGGTNATSLADKAVLITQDSGTDTVSAAAMSSNGQLLIGGTSGPAVGTLTAGSNVTITNADGEITIAAASSSGDITGVTLTGDDSNTASDTAGSADFTIAGGSGLTTSVSGTTVTVAGDNASTSAKGVAQFSSDNFAASSGTITIKDGGIVTAELAADAVTSAKIADDAIGSEHIADDAVVTAAIADDAITSALIADDAVVSASVADSAITTALIAADAVTGAKIADNAIDSDHYTDGSIDTAHIADNNVTAAKIFDLARGSILYGNASAATAELTAGSANTVLTSDGNDISWAAASGGGFEEVDMWRLHTSLTGDADPISSNLERVDTGGFAAIKTGNSASGMSESSGVFTFPQTGIYKITFHATLSGAGGSGSADTNVTYSIKTTNNNGTSYTTNTSHLLLSLYNASAQTSGTTHMIFDVTDTSQDKVAFKVGGQAASNKTEGWSDISYTYFLFERLGDT